jgi:hypothetical protein
LAIRIEEYNDFYNADVDASAYVNCGAVPGPYSNPRSPLKARTPANEFPRFIEIIALEITL